MKTAAKISIVLACIAVLAAGAYALTSRLKISFEINLTPAIRAEDKFNQIKTRVTSGEFDGVSALGDINEYYFLTVRAEIKSYSPFKAEWISLSVLSDRDDVLTVSDDGWLKELGAFGMLYGDDAPSVTILTKSSEASRDAFLEYYIFGRNHSSSAR